MLGFNELFQKKLSPDFIFWNLSKSWNFEYRYQAKIEKVRYVFRNEVRRACEIIDKNRKQKVVALCHTGGIDSEIIANTLREMGIPYICYFLDIWGVNLKEFEYNVKNLQVRENFEVVHLEKKIFYEQHSIPLFRATGCELPTYLAMAYLFNHIPQNQFIVVGDGDLNRGTDLHKSISKNHLGPIQKDVLKIPFSLGNIFYYLWAKKNKRDGEFYFFSSTPELLASVYLDPLYEGSQTRLVIYSNFPEIKPRPKTSNWDSAQGSKESKWIRDWLIKNTENELRFKNWKRSIGTMVDVSSLF